MFGFNKDKEEKEVEKREKEEKKKLEREKKEAKKKEKEEKKRAKDEANRNPDPQNTTSPATSPSVENKKEVDANNNVSPKRPYQLIVVDGDETHDWVALFSGLKLKDGSPIRVIQASWLEIDLVVYSDSGCLLTIAPFRESEGQVKRPQTLTVKPDFFIIRNQVRGPTPESDRLRLLYGLMHAGVPAINSLESEYMNLERPIMFGALKQIEKRLGHDKFPLISQNYYASHKNMIIPPSLPGIVKISHAHAGMGKIQIKDSTEFRDLATVLALHHDYCTAEPYIEPEYGIRVQKIGSSYRVYKKIFTGSGWKSQFGGADLQVIPLTDEFKLWADECAKLFGGMDILAIDGLFANGKMYIIELNSTAIGIHRHYWEEDTKVLCELAVSRMNEIYIK